MYKTLRSLLIFGFFLPCAANAIESKVAYLAHTNGFWQVWTMSANGENKQQITSSRYDKSHISWYSDGLHLLVNSSQGRLQKLSLITKKVEPIELPVKGAVDAVISPNGQQIVFSLSVAGSRDNNHIWLVDVDGNHLRKLTNMGGLQHEPTWGPNGQWVYFLSSTNRQAHDIWRVSIKTKSTEQLTVNELYHFDLAFSLQGDMAFSSNRSGHYDIWLRDKQGKEIAITNHDAIDSRPTFSASGNDIIFESSRNGIMNIWYTDIGGKAKQLTDEAIGARFPIWWQSKKVGL